METYYSINSKISWRFIQNEILILDSNGKQAAHDLNQIGSYIFEKIYQGVSTQQILQLLLNQYGDTPEVKNDFFKFLKELEDLAIICPAPHKD
jgi:cytochrome c-type biogenesis protein CcmH/NrfF|tara:strand:- start:110808 stop:111086 length:279 start_codon:yes stop_codon:yes gene_type:complete